MINTGKDEHLFMGGALPLYRIIGVCPDLNTIDDDRRSRTEVNALTTRSKTGSCLPANLYKDWLPSGNSFGERTGSLLDGLGIYQHTMATALKLSDKTISNWKIGKALPRHTSGNRGAEAYEKRTSTWLVSLNIGIHKKRADEIARHVFAGPRLAKRKSSPKAQENQQTKLVLADNKATPEADWNASLEYLDGQSRSVATEEGFQRLLSETRVILSGAFDCVQALGRLERTAAGDLEDKEYRWAHTDERLRDSSDRFHALEFESKTEIHRATEKLGEIRAEKAIWQARIQDACQLEDRLLGCLRMARETEGGKV